MRDPTRNREALPRLLYSEREAAEMLGYSIRQMFNLRQEGRLPYVLVGKGRPRYSAEDLQAYIDNHRHVGAMKDKVGQ